jgi:hypothetical protein
MITALASLIAGIAGGLSPSVAIHLALGILASWTFPFSDVMTQAQEFANALWPVFVMPIGLLVGIGVLNYVIKAVRSALGSFS